jgi:glycosyltransferase involved in cell wall biosynthesis
MSHHQAEGLSFLLPVHNQAGTLQHVMSVWSGTLKSLERPYEILIIDDASTDATNRILEGMVDRIGNLRVLKHTERRGYGAAIRTGLAAAQQPLIFYTGCDYSYEPADLKVLLHHIEHTDPETGRKLEVVNGYRVAVPVSGWPKYASRIWRGFLRVAFGLQVPPRRGFLGESAHRYALLVRALFGVRVGDIDSKFKLFRKRIFERIPIQSDGDFVHAEILAKANFLGCLMDEAPIAARPSSFTAHAEPPPPVSRGKELRRVFFRPNFGPANLGRADEENAKPPLPVVPKPEEPPGPNTTPEAESRREMGVAEVKNPS